MPTNILNRCKPLINDFNWGETLCVYIVGITGINVFEKNFAQEG